MTKKSYTTAGTASLPALLTDSQLTQTAMQGLVNRGIETETALRYGVRTSRDGNQIEFPYEEAGQEVNCKYRTPVSLGSGEKRMWQVTGAVQTLYNVDILEDPDLYREDQPEPLIICEGEMDLLSFAQAGYERVVSPPNGAPSNVQDGPIDDSEGDFQCFDRNADKLRKVRKIIVATDADTPGQNLAEEIVRRFGPARCSFVTYPEGAKDGNDVLVRYGAEGIKALIDGAQPYPVKGLYTFDQLPKEAAKQPVSTGWLNLDKGFKPFPGLFTVMTAIPGAGKTTLAIALLANLNRLHGWKICIGSLENSAWDFVEELRRYYLRKHQKYATPGEVAQADEWINQNFVFICNNVDAGDEMDLDQFMDSAASAVVHHGVKAVLLDPYNQLESRRRDSQTETEYSGKCIFRMRNFANRHKVFFLCVCHPTKEAKNHKASEMSLYDISGSAHWCNKVDGGLTLWRAPNSNIVELKVAKWRYREFGRQWHKCKLMLDAASGHYSEADT